MSQGKLLPSCRVLFFCFFSLLRITKETAALIQTYKRKVYSDCYVGVCVCEGVMTGFHREIPYFAICIRVSLTHKLAILALKAFASNNEKTPVTEKLPAVAFDPPISGLSIQHSIH